MTLALNTHIYSAVYMYYLSGHRRQCFLEKNESLFPGIGELTKFGLAVKRSKASHGYHLSKL